MSQVPATTTTLPVMTVCSSASTTTTTVVMVLTSMEIAAASSEHDVVLLPPLIPRDTIIGVVGLTTVLQQPKTQMPPQAYAHYDMGPPQVSFSFSELSVPLISSCW